MTKIGELALKGGKKSSKSLVEAESKQIAAFKKKYGLAPRKAKKSDKPTKFNF